MRAAPAAGSFLGHPKGLYVLAFTEMWERFSYYGMRALLIFYLTEKLLLSDTASFAIYGSYTSLVFATPILGGLLADRYLGFRKAVTLGGLFMIAGHLGLASLETPIAADLQVALRLQLFYLSLALLIVGVGLFKPNVTTMVAELYPPGSALKDSAFTIFVCGINLGAMSAALVCGYVGHEYGWGYGFAIAALGIGIGLLVFARGQRQSAGHRQPSGCAGAARYHSMGNDASGVDSRWLADRGAAAVAARAGRSLGYGMAAVFILVAGWSLVNAVTRLQAVERDRFFASLALMAVWIVAAAFIEQEGSSINLFTERMVDRRIALPGAAGEIEIRTAQLLATPAFLLILGSPFFAWAWRYLALRKRNPPTTVKFALSLLMLAGGFGVLTLGISSPDENGRVALVWLLLLYAFFAAGTLLIIPAGLAAITQLAARGAVGFMMGFWLLSNAMGNFLSARIASRSSLDTLASLPAATSQQLLMHYQDFFGNLALVALVLGLAVLLSTSLIRRWMHGVT